MTKVEEIISKYSFVFEDHNVEYLRIEDAIAACKEYSEWYASECLDIAANNAKVTEQGYEPDGCEGDIEYEFVVDGESIKNIKFPSHE